MPSIHNPWLRALCLAFIVSLNLLLTKTASRADDDDHSYLPPWMRGESAAARASEIKVDPAKGPSPEAQPPMAEAQLVRITEPPSPSFAAKVTQAKAKVAKFVSNLFNKSINFAKGE
jgi:hypothetical protein